MVLVTPIDRSSELVLPSPERTHTEGDSTCITAVAPPKKDGLSILSNTTMQSTTTDHSPTSCRKEVERHPFYRVEVSIQGLQDFQQPQVHGQTSTGVEGEDLLDISMEQPNSIFGAAIAFGGSSKRNNIQVGSSIVCGQTGHLLVESEEVTDRTQIQWSVQDKQPHMSMVIPVSSVDQTRDTTPTSVVAPTKMEEEKKDEDVPMDISFNDDSDNMSTSSAGWSLLDSSDKKHPENVVEVLLRLKQSAQTEAAVASYWDGVAYLIVPPSSGHHVVSVPIQIPKTSTQPRSVSGSLHQGPANAPRLSLSPLEGATLNIIVDVIPTDECPNTKDDSMTMDSSLVTPVAGSPRVPVTPDSDDSPLEEKIKASEERALQDFVAERAAAAATRSNRITPEQADTYFSLALLWDTLFQSCDLDHSCFGTFNEQHESDDLMDNSTIATRPSLGI